MHFFLKVKSAVGLNYILLSCENRVKLGNDQAELISVIGHGEKCSNMESEVRWFQHIENALGFRVVHYYNVPMPDSNFMSCD